MQKQIASEPTKTILVITVGMLIIYAITDWKYAFYISLVVSIPGLLSDYVAKKIEFIWMKLAWVLSLIVPNILLSIIFYLLLTPIAFFARVWRRKNMLSLKNTESSLFKNSGKNFDKASFENPW